MAELVTDRETAVLVPVPEAERVVSPHRSHLDGAAALAYLTVGDREGGEGRPAGGVAELRAAEAAVLAELPVRARVSRVWLMAGSDALGSWHVLAELPLAPG